MPFGISENYLSSVFGLSSLILTAKEDKPVIVFTTFASGSERNLLHSIFLLNMLLGKLNPNAIFVLTPL